jgi:DeoR family transcriptional regulator of aga operon
MNVRQKTLLDKLRKTGKLAIAEEAVLFNVSEMTIRRDLLFFETSGLLVRTYGGAMLRDGQENALFPMDNGNETKIRIAKAALSFVKSGLTIMLSPGTTTLQFARQLALSDITLSVVTNSLPIAAVLFKTNIQVMLLGGALRSNSIDLVGPITEKTLDEFYIDILFNGCDGASSDEGFFTTDMNLASMEKKSVQKSGKVIILTESHKFKKRSFVRFASLKEVSTVITDKQLLPEDKLNLENNNISVICC